MQKLDNKNRLVIPKTYYDTCGINFSKDVGLFLIGNEMFLGNFVCGNFRYRCLGKIHVDNGRRFVVPKLAREVLHLKSGDAVVCYYHYGKLTFLKTTLRVNHR